MRRDRFIVIAGCLWMTVLLLVHHLLEYHWSAYEVKSSNHTAQGRGSVSPMTPSTAAPGKKQQVAARRAPQGGIIEATRQGGASVAKVGTAAHQYQVHNRAPCPAPELYRGHDIVGHDLGDRAVLSAHQCCEWCSQYSKWAFGNDRCAGWSFLASTSICYLKSAQGPRKANAEVLSGQVGCCPAPKKDDVGVAQLDSFVMRCAMEFWWAGVRLMGVRLMVITIKSAEQCCQLCGEDSSACKGWTFSTEDHYCTTLRTIEKTGSCTTCQSGTLGEASAMDMFGHTSPQPTVSNNFAGERAYAAQVLHSALEDGRNISYRYGVPNDLVASSRDIVIVACWRRPVFLLRTLVHLLKAAGSEQNFYLFVVDMHATRLVEEIASVFPVPHHILRIQPHFFSEAGWGNSYAVLEGYRYARSLAGQLGSELVYSVEEDVFVAADFFQFHRAAHSRAPLMHGSSATGGGQQTSLCAQYLQTACVQGTTILDRRKIFAVLAFNQEITGVQANPLLEPCFRFSDSTKTRAPSPQAGDAELAKMVYAKPIYASIGLSIRRDTLDAIVELARPEFYENPALFLEKRFHSTGSQFNMSAIYGASNLYTEQDGLITRLLLERGGLVVLPRCPRAFHAGFIGYNRLDNSSNGLTDSNLQKQYEELASMRLADMESKSSIKDVKATPLDGYFTPELNYCTEGESVQATSGHYVKCGVGYKGRTPGAG